MATANTGIEWTDATWNPVRGCAIISEGCRNCYAMKFAHRFSGEGKPYAGLTVLGNHGPRWTGEARFVPEAVGIPLRWREPKRIFVNSMSDLFHENISNEDIAWVFQTMQAGSRHTFQILTKRAKRMREWFAWAVALPLRERARLFGTAFTKRTHATLPSTWWPNVWLGVSVENQAAADERIPYLLDTPAAVRFLSCEPLLGPVDLSGWGDAAPEPVASEMRAASWDGYPWEPWVPESLRKNIVDDWRVDYGRGPYGWLADHIQQQVPRTGAVITCACDSGRRWCTVDKMATDGVRGRYVHLWNNIGCIVTDDGEIIHASGGAGSGWLSRWLQPDGAYRSKLNWVIVGGESGPGARPHDVAWARRLVRQCKARSVPVFVKQLGAVVVDRNDAGLEAENQEPVRVRLLDRSGGDMAEWPADLRVREFPTVSP